MSSRAVSLSKSRVHGLTVAALLGTAAFGCGYSGPGLVTPLPPGCPADSPPSTATELDACTTGLVFEDLEAAGDQQRLIVFEKTGGSPCPPGVPDSIGSCRAGPLAKIEPETHSHLRSYSELKRGRIIARLSLAQGETEDYDKLALARDRITYWWVQLTNTTDTLNAGKSYYVRKGENGATKLVQQDYVLRYTPHPDRFKQALARFIWDPTDDKTQGSCSQGCCH